MRDKKRVAVDDFIACAEKLVEEGITSPDRLAARGGSAGGIVVGGAITRRPDLFAAAVVHSGVLNVLRSETTAGGPANVVEYGTVEIRTEFEALLALDAVHSVSAGVEYPTVLLFAGANDVRVPVWQSAKFAARLQAVGTTAFLRLDAEGGHGFGDTRKQEISKQLDEDLFLWWQLGAPESQP